MASYQRGQKWNVAVEDYRDWGIPASTQHKPFPLSEDVSPLDIEWRDKQIVYIIRNWDSSNTWNEKDTRDTTWELEGITGLPPEVFQSYLGRLSALPIQHEFRTMDIRVRPTRREYEIYTYGRFGVTPERLRKNNQVRRCAKTPGNPVVDAYHTNNCHKTGGMTTRHNSVLHRFDDCLHDAGIRTLFDKRGQMEGTSLRPGDIIVRNAPSELSTIPKKFEKPEHQESANHNNRSSDERDSSGSSTEVSDIGIDGTIVSSTKGLTSVGYTGRTSRITNPKSRRYRTGIPARRAEKAKYSGPYRWRENVDPRPLNDDMQYGVYLRTIKHMGFIPMAFESSGAVGTTFFPVLRIISEIYNEENKYEQAQFRIKWRRTIGMAVHKGVAKRFLLSLDEHLGKAGKCF